METGDVLTVVWSLWKYSHSQKVVLLPGTALLYKSKLSCAAPIPRINVLFKKDDIQMGGGHFLHIGTDKLILLNTG